MLESLNKLIANTEQDEKTDPRGMCSKKLNKIKTGLCHIQNEKYPNQEEISAELMIMQ